MKYVIMADGKGARWKNHGDIPKHFIQVNGETLIGRTVRLLKELDREATVIITSHDPRYEIEGARRYEPEHNVLEIDRFTEELIEDHMCFLYGDTYYSEKAMELILHSETEDLLFFGNRASIVAVKIQDAAVFRYHVSRVRELFLRGEIRQCIGWQVYQSFLNLPFGEKKIAGNYICIDDSTQDFNEPDDLKNIERN